MTTLFRKIALFIISMSLLPASLLFDFSVKHAAASTPPSFVIDGKHFAPPEGEAAPYINKDQRTMVPIRLFAEALGVPNDDSHIGWYQEIRTAVISYEDRVISIKLGDRKITVNGEEVPMDTAAEIRNSRVFIPVRYIAEALDANVQWDNENRTVIIFSKSFLENHRAMQTGYFMDIDNHWIVPAFYEKWKTAVHVARYDGPEHLQRVIREAREIANKVTYKIDDLHESVTVILPEYDESKYRGYIDSSTREQAVGSSATLTVRIAERHLPSDGLFRVTISDYEFGYVVVSVYGFYKEDGTIEFMEGTLAEERARRGD